MGNTPSHQGGTPPQDSAGFSSVPAPPVPGGKDKDKEPAKPPSPEPPQTPLLMPYAGHLSPQNPHALGLPQAHDYSKTIVTALILNQQLAPFYRGLDDYEEDWSEEDVAQALCETREKDFAEQVQNSATSRLRDEREVIARGRKLDHEAERAERNRREDKAYLGALECPICFLYYPPNINTSRCCQQPLCTECFVQIKRAEATTTHLESEPACCPFCVETDFGVIYERPTGAQPTPSGILSPVPGAGGEASASALATSPEAGTSTFSNALSVCSEPMASDFSQTWREEGKRRKSVSSKAKEVVTIDEIRPDWESKLNAVKAQAARRAARRIVMRQVGDRLVPIGYTSSRATGQADFSMSIPPDEGGSRRSRRTREREREMEEMMIMEAMRLSLLDHEQHQRKQAADKKQGEAASSASASGSGQQASASNIGNGAGPSTHGTGTSSPTPSTSSRRSSRATDTLASWRQNEGGGGRAAKLLSKISGNRSRANSKSSVHFAPSPTTLGAGTSTPTGSRARSSSTPSPAPGLHPEHQPSPLGGSVTSRRSLDVPGTHRPAASQALQAAVGPSEPSITEVATPGLDERNENPLARELAAASSSPPPGGSELVESPLTELAPPVVVQAPPGEDLMRFNTDSPLEPSDGPSHLSDTTPGASPSRRAAALPPTDEPPRAPTPPDNLGSNASTATIPSNADTLATFAGQTPETAPTKRRTPPPVPEKSAPAATPAVPAGKAPTELKTPSDSPVKPPPMPFKPQRADTSTSLVSVDAASFVSHSSLGSRVDDDIVRRPSDPLASYVDED